MENNGKNERGEILIINRIRIYTFFLIIFYFYS